MVCVPCNTLPVSNLPLQDLEAPDSAPRQFEVRKASKEEEEENGKPNLSPTDSDQYAFISAAACASHALRYQGMAALMLWLVLYRERNRVN